MSLYTFLRVLLRNWWLIVLSIVITAGSTTVFVLVQKPIYQTSTTIELKPSAQLEDPNQILNTINALTRRNVINTIARKATSATMQEEVATTLNVPVETVKSSTIVALVLPDTNLIEIRVEGTDATFIAQLANTVAQKMLGRDYDTVLEMEVIDPALVPMAPIAPQPARMILLGLLFGLAIGVGFAVLEHGLQVLRTSPTVKEELFGAIPAPLANSTTEQAIAVGAKEVK